MPHFTIKSEKIAGITIADALPNKEVTLCCKNSFTSDQPFFYTVMEETNKIFLNKIPYPVDPIYKMLVLLHNNDMADIYINDFPEIRKVKINRTVKSGDPIYRSDIADIVEIRFRDIPISSDDAIFYCSKIGWKFGLYFDFTRKLDPDEFAKALGQLHKGLIFEKMVSSADYELSTIPSSTSFIITEGKTDWKHLFIAGQSLNVQLSVAYFDDEEDRGDKELLSMCEHYSRIPQSRKIVFVFDQDNPTIIKTLDTKTKKGTNYQIWGNNVFSFYIPKPSCREKYKNISIEFYYTDDEIHIKDPSTGKQLLFTNEVDKRVSATTNKCKIIKRDKAKSEEEYEKKIYDKDVDNILDENGVSVAHSKTVFADNIYNKNSNFKDFDFSKFKMIFDIIETIINER